MEAVVAVTLPFTPTSVDPLHGHRFALLELN